ncbi:hypothetical protein ACVQ9Z_13045 [Staphylococcus aureus]
MYKSNEYQNKKSYYETLVNQVIELKQADDLIIGLAYSVQRCKLAQIIYTLSVIFMIVDHNQIKLWIH